MSVIFLLHPVADSITSATKAVSIVLEYKSCLNWDVIIKV